MKIAYCIPGLYNSGGMERVLTLKANYFADVLGYDVIVVLTEGKGKDYYYKLSSRIKVINLDINLHLRWVVIVRTVSSQFVYAISFLLW